MPTTATTEPLRRHFFGDLFKQGRYQPLHHDLFEARTPDHWREAGWLVPEFCELFAAIERGGPDSMPHLNREAPGVYSFDLFTPAFCDKLLEEVEYAQRTHRQDLERPNGMNRYGIVLNQLGLEPAITGLQQQYLLPLQAALFPEEGAEADDHHCFIVRYKAGEDVGLDMHEDDSDVTLNVCLGKDFTGSTLSFCGRVPDADHRKLSHTYAHRKGQAVLHLGRHRHGADNIESGERVNLILWSTSKAYRNSDAFQQHRLRSTNAETPEKICLSYTHDRDYTMHLKKPSTEEAISRGVMLDIVEKRHEIYQRPVHDLSRPLQEINQVPSVCLFMEGLPPQIQHELFGKLMMIATEVLERLPSSPGQVSPLLFFVGLQAGGAVPQVRGMCGVEGSPRLVIMDVDKECRYVLPSTVAVDAGSIRSFVEAFLAGELNAEPL